MTLEFWVMNLLKELAKADNKDILEWLIAITHVVCHLIAGQVEYLQGFVKHQKYEQVI